MSSINQSSSSSSNTVDKDLFNAYQCPFLFTSITDSEDEAMNKYKRRGRIYNSERISNDAKKDVAAPMKYTKTRDVGLQDFLIKQYAFINRNSINKYYDANLIENQPKKGVKIMPSIVEILEPMKKNTGYNYKSWVNKLHKYLYKTNLPFTSKGEFLVDDKKKVIKYLNDELDDKKRIDLLRVILLIMDKNIELGKQKWYNEKKDYMDMFKATTSNNKNWRLGGLCSSDEEVQKIIKQMTDDEKINWLPYDEIIELYEQNQDKLDSLQKVILGLELYLPGRSEKKTLKFLEPGQDINKDNYLFSSEDNNVIDRIVLNNYKTQDIYGQKLHEIPEKLVNILQEYSTDDEGDSKFNYGDSLFTPDTQKKYGVKFKAAMKKLTKKNIDMDLFRRIYISYLWKEPRSIEQMTKDSMFCCNDLQTQLDVYVRHY